MQQDLREQGFEAHLLEVPDGEDAKKLEVAGFCWDVLGQLGFTRSDAVVGLGGGATTDLAGWVAAAWLRGVRVVQVATTLAGMVDAAVGGKTAVNTARGKNLVGAFHPPAGVLCDLATLRTLPAHDYVAGLAEVVKCGFIADPAILDLIERDPAAASAPGNPAERELVERSVRVKAARGVGRPHRAGPARDPQLRPHPGPRDRARRALPVAARRRGVGRAGLRSRARTPARAPRRRHRRPAPRGARPRSGCPPPTAPTPSPQLLESMRVDKKARGNRLRFVVLDGLARPVAIDDPDPAVLVAAYSEVAAS